MWSNIVFSILFGALIIISLLHLIDAKKAGKRMDRNADLLERWVKLLEKESFNETVKEWQKTHDEVIEKENV